MRMTRIAPKTISPEASPIGAISYQAFLHRDGENQHVEWVNGEVVAMAAITGDHNLTTNFLTPAFQFFIEARDAGEIRTDPFQMKTGPDLPGRAPDLLFVSKRHLSRLKRLYLDGPADLVVEAISPGSRGVDRGDKFFEYERGGVREYWLIDPERKQAEFYRRGRDGIFKPVAVGSDGIFHSNALKGMWIKVDWLWRRPLPSQRSVYEAWGLL